MNMRQGISKVTRHDFAFAGTGREYFKIWLVNLALTVLTLGIYSAWAKVRKQQYFYRNTILAGSSFDYHGDPKKIIRSRLIVAGVLSLYQLFSKINPMWAGALVLILVLLMPKLIQLALRFKFAVSSYRGLRFHFGGSTADAYKAFLLWPLLGLLTFGLLLPRAFHAIKAYIHGNGYFGKTAFKFRGSVLGFYEVYLAALLMLAALIYLILVFTPLGALLPKSAHPTHFSPKKIGWFIAFIPLFFLTIWGLYIVLKTWLSANIQNLAWNATTLGKHQFSSHVQARHLLWIYFTNTLGLVLTFGLYKPFGDVRLAKYRLSQLSMMANGNFDDFVAQNARAIKATGESFLDAFDFYFEI